MSTTYCAPETVSDDIEIIKYNYSYSVFPGNTWKIDVTVKSIGSNLYGDFCKINVLDKDTMEILATSSFDLPPGATKVLNYTGIMPDKNLHINLSLIDVEPFWDGCECGKEFTIKLASTSEEEQEQPGEPGTPYLMYAAIALAFLMVIGLIFLLIKR